MIRKSDYENYDYRQFWQNDKRIYEDRSERLAIRKFFKNVTQTGKIFADLGCGFGRLFNEYEGFRIIILVDYSLNNLKNAKSHILDYPGNDRSRMAKIFFVLADVNNLPLKKSIIDTCITVRVIHHLSDPQKYFSEVSRIIKPDGLFMLEFANKRNLKNILRFIFRKIKESPFSIKPFQVGETILDYHPKYIKRLLKNLGFSIIRSISASNFRLSFIKRHVSLKILVFFENLWQNVFSFADVGPSIFLKTAYSAGKEEVEPAGESANEEIHSHGTISADSFLQARQPDAEGEIFACPSCKNEKLVFVRSKKKDNLEIQKDSQKNQEGSGRAEKSILCKKCGRQFSVVDRIYCFKL